MSINIIETFSVGFLLSVLFLVIVKKACLLTRFFPSQKISPAGGISMGLAFFAGVFWTCFSGNVFPPELTGILIASAVILLAGVMDDKKELSVLQKLFAQVVAASFLIGFGVRTDFVYLGNFANMALSFLWIIGISNAINLLDIVDGMAASVSVIIVSVFAAIAWMNGDNLTLIVTLVLSGTILGFLIFNLPPAKVYMGNSGSHFIGLVIAAAALTGQYATMERPLALLTPVLLLGLPILDTVLLVWVRIRRGKSAFAKSEDHMALQLLKNGYSKHKTLLIMMGITLFFAGCGFFLGRVSSVCAAGILFLSFGISILILKKMGRVQS
ncbi:MAG: putative undecaprenyl-phosphate N-acetylglucosaminyl 1-phosphate transferase [Candidatus Omnitrophica bacterium ADurb.Bin277]|nr:MAG: putative undecaprenyl-phosphate N-acetylglucosaminyl 1-phosphate transferase [Candidatus Omnitrophica bacterium ADurb.Bin277]